MSEYFSVQLVYAAMALAKFVAKYVVILMLSCVANHFACTPNVICDSILLIKDYYKDRVSVFSQPRQSRFFKPTLPKAELKI